MDLWIELDISSVAAPLYIGTLGELRKFLVECLA